MIQEPTKTIELNEGQKALVYADSKTLYLNAEGDTIASLPFPVDEKIAYICLVAYVSGHDKGMAAGQRKGRKAIVDTIHELLGVERIAKVLSEGIGQS